MHYIPKVPARWDFCGRPPCPLCFDPVEDNGERQDSKERVYRDMGASTPEQQAAVDAALEKVHEANLAAKDQPPAEVDVERLAARFDATKRKEIFHLQLNALHDRREKEKALPPPPPTRPQVYIDMMPAEKVEATITADMSAPAPPQQGGVLLLYPEYVPK